MGFMKGVAPIRRTLKYLESGKIVFRDNVKIFSINFNRNSAKHGKHNEGARDFVFWHLSQIQYKNPYVQCMTFEGLTPTPFIRVYFDDAKSVLIDLDSKEKEEILDHLVNFTAICKSKTEINETKETSGKTASPAQFGIGCARHCICEILGQVPCPRIVKLPTSWRARGRPDAFIKKFKIPLVYMEKDLVEEEKDD